MRQKQEEKRNEREKVSAIWELVVLGEEAGGKHMAELQEARERRVCSSPVCLPGSV